LWKPEPDPATRDHGGTPAARVALTYSLELGQIEVTVGEKRATYPHLPLTREEVSIDKKGHKGVVVRPIPGSTPSTEVYVPVNGWVHQVNVYGERLDADGRNLLSSLRFDLPLAASRLARAAGGGRTPKRTIVRPTRSYSNGRRQHARKR
jgi:hypothetical protein